MGRRRSAKTTATVVAATIAVAMAWHNARRRRRGRGRRKSMTATAVVATTAAVRRTVAMTTERGLRSNVRKDKHQRKKAHLPSAGPNHPSAKLRMAAEVLRWWI